nr:DMT family transporter [Candidatus Sigynarchaeum springense]MDO8116736.1 DMT family transporter [Candidatus Sigynarchaeota archaeon]
MVIIVWGGSFLVIGQLVAFATPLTIATWRAFFTSGIFLAIQPYAKIRGWWQRVNSGKLSPRHRNRSTLFIVIAGLSGVGFYFPVQYGAVELAGPSIAALMVCLGSPVIIIGLSALIFKERVGWKGGVGLLLASFGALLIITGGDLSTLTPRSSNFFGNLLVLLTPVLWSTFSISSKKAHEFETPLKTIALTMHVGTAVLVLFSLISQDVVNWGVALQHPVFHLGMLYISLGCSVYGYFAWNVALSKLPAGSVGSFLYVEPFITVFFAWTRGQFISPHAILGGVIVFFSLILITRTGKGMKT